MKNIEQIMIDAERFHRGNCYVEIKTESKRFQTISGTIQSYVINDNYSRIVVEEDSEYFPRFTSNENYNRSGKRRIVLYADAIESIVKK
jgi:hypothetical protein